MSYAYLCDFDGTVSPADIGAALVARFRSGRDPELDRTLERWRAGEIGHRELTEAECRAMAADESEALAFTRSFRIDPDFAAFAREARGRGERVMVVSEGLHFYVRDQLERAGLGDLPCSSNRSRFEGNRIHPEFPNAGRGCGRCGNCKGQHVRDHQAEGYEVVFVGDGFSDRCGARAADHVLARGDLLAWCESQGIAAAPFRSFADVRVLARGLPRGGRREA